MPVIINFKICDNSKACGGIESCPTHALFWDKKNNTIGIDNSKCTNCETCVKSCPIGAIQVAHTNDEYKILQQKNYQDQRKLRDLFIDRYGATPINPAFSVSQSDLDKYITQATKPIVIELFDNNSIECLLKSIPIKNLFNFDIQYLKIEVKNHSLLKTYNIQKLPCLLFFKNNQLIDKIEGYYEDKQKQEIQEKINKITNLLD